MEDLYEAQNSKIYSYIDILIGTGVDVCCNFCYTVTLDYGSLFGHFQHFNCFINTQYSVWDFYRSTKNLLLAIT